MFNLPPFRWGFAPLRSPEGENGGSPTATPPAGDTAKPADPSGADGAAGGTTTPGATGTAEGPQGNGSLIPEGGATGATGPTGEATGATGPASQAEPEKVDLTKLTLPEGLAADDAGLTKAAEVLQDPKLSTGQKLEALAGSYKDALTQVAEKASAAAHQAYTDLNTAWVAEIKADANVGGDKLDGTLRVISQGIDKWAPDAKAFKQALEITGAGNNPAVIRTLHRMFSHPALSEGAPAQGGGTGGSKSAAELMYGGNPK